MHINIDPDALTTSVKHAAESSGAWHMTVVGPWQHAPFTTSGTPALLNLLASKFAVSCVVTLKVIVAESFGGDDEPVDSLMADLNGVGVEVLGDALRVKETPTNQLYQAFEEAGTDLAQVIHPYQMHCSLFLVRRCSRVILDALYPLPVQEDVTAGRVGEEECAK